MGCRCFLKSLLGSIWITTAACAAGENEAANLDVKVESVRLGKSISGPAVTADNLRNHVVLLEFWGMKSSSSLTGLSQLDSWQDQYADQGLVVIGMETQGADEEEIRKLAGKRGFKFSLVQNGGVDGIGEIKTTPHCLVFAHTGKCVYRGAPAQAGPKLKETIQAAPSPVLLGREFKKLGSLAAAYAKPDSAAAVIKKAQARIGAADADTSAEAKWIVEKLTAYGQQQLDLAKAKKSDDPIESHAILQKISVDFKDLEIGTSASATLAEMLRDIPFTRELAAHDLLLKVRALEAKLQLTHLDPKSTDFKYPNSPLLLQMASTIRIIFRQYPTTKANDEAKEIVERYDLHITKDKGTSGGM